MTDRHEQSIRIVGGIPDVTDSLIDSTGLIGDGSRVFDPESAPPLDNSVDIMAPMSNRRTSKSQRLGGVPELPKAAAPYVPQPENLLESGVIIAYFHKDISSLVEVRPPRTEIERELTERIIEPVSGKKINFSHSVQNEEVEIIGVKRKYLDKSDQLNKPERKEIFLSAVSELARILGNREFDGELHRQAKTKQD